MRLLCAVILLCIALPAAADEPTTEQSVDSRTYIASLGNRPVISGDSAWFIKSADGTESKLQELRRLSPKQFRSSANPSKNACYTMHSIIVRQPDKDSDAIRTVGERTCTAASKFKVKQVGPSQP